MVVAAHLSKSLCVFAKRRRFGSGSARRAQCEIPYGRKDPHHENLAVVRRICYRHHSIMSNNNNNNKKKTRTERENPNLAHLGGVDRSLHHRQTNLAKIEFSLTQKKRVFVRQNNSENQTNEHFSILFFVFVV